MPRIHLTDPQRSELQALRRSELPAVARDRLEMVFLSDAGWSSTRIGAHLGRHPFTVRSALKGFAARGAALYPDAPGPDHDQALRQRPEWDSLDLWQKGVRQMKEPVTLGDAVSVGTPSQLEKALEPFLADVSLRAADELRPIHQERKLGKKVPHNELLQAAVTRLTSATSLASTGPCSLVQLSICWSTHCPCLIVGLVGKLINGGIASTGRSR
jgi:hypothetical protein